MECPAKFYVQDGVYPDFSVGTSNVDQVRRNACKILAKGVGPVYI
jgi:hypothetical protein